MRPFTLPPVTAGDRDLGGRTRLDAALGRLTDETRADEAARVRSREHWLRRQADEDASLTGVLVDLAERGDRVVLSTVARRRHRGWLLAVGDDFCLVRAETGTEVLVSHRGLATVRAEPGGRSPRGDRAVVTASTLVDQLVALGADRPRVLVAPLVADDAVVGTLVSVGHDVLAVRLDGAERSVVYVPLDSLAEVSFTVSG